MFQRQLLSLNVVKHHPSHEKIECCYFQQMQLVLVLLRQIDNMPVII